MSENITIKKFEDFKLKKILSDKQILRMQELVKDIYLSKKIREYILNIVKETREKNFENAKYIEWGASPRASIALFITSKARALMEGRTFVVPKDVKNAALEVLRHRLILSFKATAEGINSDKLIKEILNRVEVP